MNSTLVRPADVDEIWHLISERIDACLRERHGDCTAGDLWTLCRAGTAFLLVAHDGTAIKSASIWRFETWTNEPVFRCLIAVGEDMESWFEGVREIVTRMAKEGGAKSLVCDGRKGWQRRIPEAQVIRQTYRIEV